MALEFNNIDKEIERVMQENLLMTEFIELDEKQEKLGKEIYYLQNTINNKMRIKGELIRRMLEIQKKIKETI